MPPKSPTSHNQQRRPAVIATAMLATGILSGRVVGTYSVMYLPPWLSGSAVTLLLLVLLSALLMLYVAMRRRAFASSALLYAAVPVMGFLLIWRSDSAVTHDAGLLPSCVTAALSDVRHAFAAVYRRYGLSDDAYSVVAAMTLGERHGISPGLRAVYNACGASHVFAISGLHLSMLFFMVRHLLPVRRLPRTGSALLLVLLWAYVLMVGSPASAVRAAVMLSVYQMMSLMNRVHDGISSITFAAFVLLLFRPSWLFDLGFQMSFLAVTGISLFYRPLSQLSLESFPIHNPSSVWWYRATPRHWSLTMVTCCARWLWSMTALSLSAQLFVAPLVAYKFGYFAPWFFLTNYIVSPVAFLIISLSMLLLALSVLSLPLGWLAAVMSSVVYWLNGSLQWISQLPG